MPVHDDRLLFEMLILEGAHAGLSWETVLKKREGYRARFHNFDVARVAGMSDDDLGTALLDPGIVRHRGKIEAAIHNARRACALRDEEGSLARYFWKFQPGSRERPARITPRALARLTETDASRALARDLRQRGFRFVGPTTCYAFMQAMGMVNDHLEGCVGRGRVERARRALKRP